jgi:hypothetical protein
MNKKTRAGADKTAKKIYAIGRRSSVDLCSLFM